MANYSTSLVELDISLQYIQAENRALGIAPRDRFKERPDLLDNSFRYMNNSIGPLLLCIFFLRRGSRRPLHWYQFTLGELVFFCLELGLVGSLPFLIKPNDERVSIITLSILGKCSKADIEDIASRLPSDVAFKLVPEEMRSKEGVYESMVMTNCDISAKKKDPVVSKNSFDA